jgi:O-antigen ligase
MTTGALTGVLVGAQVSDMDAEVAITDGTNRLLLFIWIVLYSVTILLLLPHRKKAVNAIWQNKSIVLLLVLAALSTSWSEAPKSTLSHSLALIGSSIFGVYLAVRYSPKDQLRLITQISALIMMASLVVGVAMPEYGVSHGLHSGNWRGIFVQKNILGYYMELGTLGFLLSASEATTKRAARRWIGCGGCSTLLLLSGAMASILGIIVIVFLLSVRNFLLRSVKSLAVYLTLLAGVVACAVPWLLRNLNPILKLSGRDATFSGRLYLWIAVAFEILRRPWLGYGFGGFWLGPYGPSRAIWNLLGWTVPHSHNGLLDLTLDLGLAGLALFLLGYVEALGRARKHFLANRDSFESMWPLVFLGFLLLHNLAESSLVRHNSFLWIVFVATTVGLKLNEDGSLRSESEGLVKDQSCLV